MKDIFWVCVACGVLALALLGIFYQLTNKESKLLKQYKASFSTCTDYCNKLNQTGYVRYVEDYHLKCFCYSDNTKVMTNG